MRDRQRHEARKADVGSVRCDRGRRGAAALDHLDVDVEAGLGEEPHLLGIEDLGAVFDHCRHHAQMRRRLRVRRLRCAEQERKCDQRCREPAYRGMHDASLPYIKGIAGKILLTLGTNAGLL